MTPLTVVDLIDAHCEWMATQTRPRYSRRTITDRRAVLATMHRQLPHGLDDITRGELETWLFAPGHSRWTAATYWWHMVGFYRWAFATGRLTGDPTIGIHRPPSGRCDPKPLDPAEIAHALAHSPEPWYSCIILGVGAGLRASELAGIRTDDIDADLIHVWRGAKGGRERYVPTAPTVWAWVASRPAGLLVLRPSGRAVTGRWLSCRQQQHWRSIGLPDWHLHRLRHTFCTTQWDEIEAGVDPLAVRDNMGHASLATTQGYARVRQESRRRAVAAVDTLLASVCHHLTTTDPACGQPCGQPNRS